MTTSYKTVLRSHTISLGAKEKKEKNKKTITAADTRRTLLQSASSSSYFSHLEKTSESESSFCLSEMETKRKVLASLPFKEDQVETLIRKFDLETLKQAVEWEKTAHYDNLGAAFYSACKNLWKPKKSKEERFKDDKEWVQRNLGELDGKVLKRYRIDLLSKSIELIPAGGGNCQPTVLNYGEKGFREKLKSHLGIP